MDKEYQITCVKVLVKRILKYGLSCLMGYWLWSVALEENAVLAVFGFLFGFVFFIWLWTDFDRHKTEIKFYRLYKKNMIEETFKNTVLYENMTFQSGGGFSAEFINEIGLHDTKIYSSDSYLCGEHNGVKFEQADIRNWYVERISRNKGFYRLEYSGTMYVIDSNLPDANQTNICCGDLTHIILGGQYKTGNAQFDKQVTVFSDNMRQAEALLSDTVQKMILDFYHKTQREFLLTVKNGYLYVFIPDRDSALKPKLFKSFTEEMRQPVLNELRMVGRLIECFC